MVLRPKITVREGEIILLKCVDKNGDYSTYRIKVTPEVCHGDGLDNAFLAETTGYKVD